MFKSSENGSSELGVPKVDVSGLTGKQLEQTKLEFLALKWAITEQFRDYLYYAPKCVVYTDNNPLTYVLTTAKLNTTGLRWVGELTGFNFEMRYKLGKPNTEADSLSRLGVNALGNGDLAWVTSLTEKEQELLQDELVVRVIDLVRGHQEGFSIGRVLKVHQSETETHDNTETQGIAICSKVSE